MLFPIKYINYYYKKYFKQIVIVALFSIFLNNYHYHHPKISIFMTIYNMQKYLRRAVLNIQNQTLKDIEIIAINDFSNDKSLEIIEDFAKKDSRIKIVNNKKNKGLLFSRAMGILHSSGDYLMNFDADDELIGQDALEYLYNKTIFSKADIISFDYLCPKRKFKKPCNEFDIIIKQPKLFKSIYSNSYDLKDFFIWNKLVKKEIFLESYKVFKDFIYSDKKWNYHEDNIWSILVNKLASSKLCVNKKIYKYNYNNGSLINNRFSEIEFNNIMYRYDMIRKIYNKSMNYKYMRSECLSINSMIKSNKRFKNYIKSNPYFKNMSYHIFKTCLDNYKIPKKRKKSFQYLIEYFQ